MNFKAVAYAAGLLIVGALIVLATIAFITGC